MSVPTHGPSCQVLVYSTNCWHCGGAIHVLQCTCGSAVLLDGLGKPWPKHDCRGAPGRIGPSGIGGSGYSGWAAVDALRSAGASITPDIIGKIFPGASPGKKAPAAPSIEAVDPNQNNGKEIMIFAIVREFNEQTKRSRQLNDINAIGARMLGLPAKGALWQLTLFDNSRRPNLSYTCLAPSRFSFLKQAKNKLVCANLAARVAGDHAIWLVSDIQLL